MARLDRTTRRLALLASPLFQVMRPAELDLVLDVASERRVARGQPIFFKGDTGTSMMAVLRGCVRIGANSPDGKEITLNVINAGGVFGEIALLDGKPRSADAVAAEDTILLVLERQDFEPLMRGNPDLTQRLLMVLCEKLRSTSVALEEVALNDLPRRLARLLLKLANEYGQATEAGVRISLRLSQRDLSNMVAASRESVNKQLSAWRDAGLVDMRPGAITVRRPEALRRVSADSPHGL